MKNDNEWPPRDTMYRSHPPEGSVGIVLPIRDDLRFFKLTFHSIISFTDHPYMLTIVDNMSSLSTGAYLEGVRRNHMVNVLWHQKNQSLGAIWNFGAQYTLRNPAVKYLAFLTPTVIVPPLWLSAMVRPLQSVSASIPSSIGGASDALLIRREVFESLGQFDESVANPAEAFAKRIADVATAPPVIHKFRVNNFDPRPEPSPATQEATHARA